jgi:riboflavin kinase / FMN adenylyltransferase
MFPADIPQALRELAPKPGLTHVAVGVFDGFHRGHRQLVTHLLKSAPNRSSTAILTFEPHPLQVIAPERAPKRLSNVRQKRELLLQAGVAEVITLAFDSPTRELSASAFIDELLRVFPKLALIVMGPRWSFGKDRLGNAALLKTIGAEKGFAVHEIEPLFIEGETASSTRIREAIANHDFKLATLLLGRSYAIEGHIVRGDGRGRTLGFPTANLENISQMLPPNGVYACRTRIGSRLVPSVLNIGTRPTFKTGAPATVEAHLLDFKADLYDQTVELTDFQFIRAEQKFSSIDALKEQISRDIVTARGLLIS